MITSLQKTQSTDAQTMLLGLTRVGRGTYKATPVGHALWVEVQSSGTQSGRRPLGTVHWKIRCPSHTRKDGGNPADRKLGRTVFTGPKNPWFLSREPLHTATVLHVTLCFV